MMLKKTVTPIHSHMAHPLHDTNSERESVDLNTIMSLIPHRYPMLLIDKVIDIEPGKSAVGVKNVSANEWFFQGHFPGHPVMPGVLIVEAMAQTSAVLVTKTLASNKAGNLVYFMSIDEAKFRKPVVPGDVLHLHVTILKSRGPVWKIKSEAFVDGELTDEAVLTAMIRDQ